MFCSGLISIITNHNIKTFSLNHNKHKKNEEEEKKGRGRRGKEGKKKRRKNKIIIVSGNYSKYFTC
jgi:hypothetical protein